MKDNINLSDDNNDNSSQLMCDINKELKKDRSFIDYVGRRKKGQSRLNYAWQKFVEMVKRFFGFRYFRDVINSEVKQIHRRLIRQHYTELHKKNENFKKKFPHFREFLSYINKDERKQQKYAHALMKLLGKIIVYGTGESPNGLTTYCPIIMHDFFPRLLKNTYGADRYKIFFWACGFGASLIFIGIGSIVVGATVGVTISTFLPSALFGVIVGFILAAIFVYAVKAILKRHIHTNAAKEISQELTQENAALAAIKYYDKNEGVFTEIDAQLEEKFHFTVKNQFSTMSDDTKAEEKAKSCKDEKDDIEEFDVEYFLSEKGLFELFGFDVNEEGQHVQKDVHVEQLNHDSLEKRH